MEIVSVVPAKLPLVVTMSCGNTMAGGCLLIQVIVCGLKLRLASATVGTAATVHWRLLQDFGYGVISR